MAADSFVLVGDHMQLPPLVVSEVADQAGKFGYLLSSPHAIYLALEVQLSTIVPCFVWI